MYESTTALPMIEEIVFNLFLSKNEKVYPNFKIRGKVSLFGYYKQYTFLTFQNDLFVPRSNSIFWCLMPLKQNFIFSVGEEVTIIYDVIPIKTLGVKLDICIIHSVV